MKTQGMDATELEDTMIGFLEQYSDGLTALIERFLHGVMGKHAKQHASAFLNERADGKEGAQVRYKP